MKRPTTIILSGTASREDTSNIILLALMLALCAAVAAATFLLSRPDQGIITHQTHSSTNQP